MVLFVSTLARLTGQVLQAHPDPGGGLRQFQLNPVSSAGFAASLAVMRWWFDGGAYLPYLDSRRTVFSAVMQDVGAVASVVQAIRASMNEGAAATRGHPGIKHQASILHFVSQAMAPGPGKIELR